MAGVVERDLGRRGRCSRGLSVAAVVILVERPRLARPRCSARPSHGGGLHRLVKAGPAGGLRPGDDATAVGRLDSLSQNAKTATRRTLAEPLRHVYWSRALPMTTNLR
jgi:hypothetical protein